MFVRKWGLGAEGMGGTAWDHAEHSASSGKELENHLSKGWTPILSGPGG